MNNEDLRNIYSYGQIVIFINDDFDAINRRIKCTVQEVNKDTMTIMDIETYTKLYIERGFNLDCVTELTEEDTCGVSLSKNKVLLEALKVMAGE